MPCQCHLENLDIEDLRGGPKTGAKQKDRSWVARRCPTFEHLIIWCQAPMIFAGQCRAAPTLIRASHRNPWSIMSPSFVPSVLRYHPPCKCRNLQCEQSSCPCMSLLRDVSVSETHTHIYNLYINILYYIKYIFASLSSPSFASSLIAARSPESGKMNWSELHVEPAELSTCQMSSYYEHIACGASNSARLPCPPEHVDFDIILGFVPLPLLISNSQNWGTWLPRINVSSSILTVFPFIQVPFNFAPTSSDWNDTPSS